MDKLPDARDLQWSKVVLSDQHYVCLCIQSGFVLDTRLEITTPGTKRCSIRILHNVLIWEVRLILG